jgi:hypothetical protein
MAGAANNAAARTPPRIFLSIESSLNERPAVVPTFSRKGQLIDQ